MRKDDERLAKLRNIFREIDADAKYMKGREASAISAAIQAESERIRLAKRNLPQTEKGILLLFNEINKDVFMEKSIVSK